MRAVWPSGILSHPVGDILGSLLGSLLGGLIRGLSTLYADCTVQIAALSTRYIICALGVDTLYSVYTLVVRCTLHTVCAVLWLHRILSDTLCTVRARIQSTYK